MAWKCDLLLRKWLQQPWTRECPQTAQLPWQTLKITTSFCQKKTLGKRRTKMQWCKTGIVFCGLSRQMKELQHHQDDHKIPGDHQFSIWNTSPMRKWTSFEQSSHKSEMIWGIQTPSYLKGRVPQKCQNLLAVYTLFKKEVMTCLE